jgi:hypothetical protein
VSLTSILKFAWQMKDVQFLLLSPLDMAVVKQSREELNEGLAASSTTPGEAMPADYILTHVMQPPRDDAQAHRY